ncbi:hypothetical protein [Micromonospora sp. NPDC005299]|uniref:hypothetical protein n=1 Tax=Micromonospora sp. NPDC005299 TaxID=3364231 RepID=UPI0036B2F25F
MPAETVTPTGISRRPALYIASTWRPTTVTTPVHDEMAARVYVPLDDHAIRNLAAQWLRDIAAAQTDRTPFVNTVNTGSVR